MKQPKPKKPKKDFMGVYKTFYNPSKEGYGNPDEWKEAFSARMGLKEAKETLGKRSPYEVLGLTSTATWDEVRKAHRVMAMKWHPDRCDGDKEEAAIKFKEVQAAYEILEDKLGPKG